MSSLSEVPDLNNTIFESTKQQVTSDGLCDQCCQWRVGVSTQSLYLDQLCLGRQVVRLTRSHLSSGPFHILINLEGPPTLNLPFCLHHVVTSCLGLPFANGIGSDRTSNERNEDTVLSLVGWSAGPDMMYILPLPAVHAQHRLQLKEEERGDALISANTTSLSCSSLTNFADVTCAFAGIFSLTEPVFLDQLQSHILSVDQRTCFWRIQTHMISLVLLTDMTVLRKL